MDVFPVRLPVTFRILQVSDKHQHHIPHMNFYWSHDSETPRRFYGQPNRLDAYKIEIYRARVVLEPSRALYACSFVSCLIPMHVFTSNPALQSGCGPSILRELLSADAGRIVNSKKVT